MGQNMKAIILAGGKGERLSPFTKDCPKGMVKIEGKPILEYQIEWLKQYGVREVVFACGYFNQVIKDYFKDGDNFSIKVKYSVEEEPLGRGGAIKKAWDMILSSEPIVVMNGDIFTEMDLNKTLMAHNEMKEKRRIVATICTFPYKSPYGIVRISDNGLVESFDEKRTLPFWVNGGIYIFEHLVKEHLPEKGDHETTTFPELATKGMLYAYRCIDYWKGIDTVKDLNEFSSEKQHYSLIRKAIGTLNPN